LARSSFSSGTTSGTKASRQGSKKTVTQAVRKVSAYTAAKEWPATNGTQATRPARSTSAAIMRVRLRERSMTAPASAPNSTYGSVNSASTMPVESAEPVVE
jgi:hypothetical protein